MVNELDLTNLKKAAGVLRALNHKLRQAIIAFIKEKGKATVTEIFNHFKIEQSVASQHLAILRNAKVLNTERDGKFIIYAVDEKKLSRIYDLAFQLTGDGH